MRTSIWILIVLSLFVSSQFSYGDENSDPPETITEKAFQKYYPGGRDEENLEVQLKLYDPERKLWPKQIQDEVYENLTQRSASE